MTVEVDKKEIRVHVGVPVLKKYTQGYGKEGDTYIDITERVSVYVEDSISSLVKTFAEYVKEYGTEYKNLELDGVSDCGCYTNDCNCSPTYYLMGTRLETDLELMIRVEKETKRKLAIEAQERAVYEALKKKFET